MLALNSIRDPSFCAGADWVVGMCPKDDDPVTVNQNERSVLVRIGTESGAAMEGTLAVTFNG